MRDTDRLPPDMPGESESGVWPYVGVGCLTSVVGFFGSAMLAVLLAKIIGGLTGCAADGETGAPCNWLTYAVRGGLIGLVVVPSFIIWRMRKARAAYTNSE
jgi:hypothetical protein